jgi:hypothetical protein
VSNRTRALKQSHTLKIILGVAVTVACLAAAMWGLPYEHIRDSFQQANYATLPVLLVLLYLFFWLKAIRWKMLLQPLRDFETREVVPAMMIGFMGNNILPAHLGEFMRMVVLGRQYKLPMTGVFSTVVLERIIDMAVILILLGGGLFFSRQLPAEYRTASLILAGLTLFAVLFVVVYVVWTGPFVRTVEWMLSKLPFVPEKLRTKLTEMLEAGAAGLNAIRSVKLLSGIVVTSFLQWFLNGCTVYVALWSFGVRDLSPAASFITMGAVAVAVIIPSTPGFIGVVQIGFTASLKLFGVEQADAFGASVYYHISQYIPVTLVGLYYLSRTGFRLGDLERDAVQEEESVAEE